MNKLEYIILAKEWLAIFKKRLMLFTHAVCHTCVPKFSVWIHHGGKADKAHTYSCY